jgi:glycosyltransferase involved in cell wall biosynthesis
VNELATDRLLDACAQMRSTLESRMYSRFLKMESDFYENIVKRCESHEHYERCFQAFEPVSLAYGDILKNKLEKSQYEQLEAEQSDYRILFLLPNLNNDLAHIEYLYNIFLHHPPDSRIRIFIAGYAAHNRFPVSKYLSRLADNGQVKLLLFEDAHAGRIQLMNLFVRYGFKRLVIFSVPLQLSAWCRALGPERVSWVATKYRLSCFPEVKSRICSGSTSANGTAKEIVEWKIVNRSLSRESIPSFEIGNRKRNKLITINREEKIADRSFLSVVSRILSQRHDTDFFWTGRRALPEITQHFSRDGLESRTHFIGWVDPANVLNKFDIFLDTPNLSGMVAAKAFAAGMPVVTFRGSESWPECFEPEIKTDKSVEWAGLGMSNLLANSEDEYVSNALNLIDFEDRYRSQSDVQERLGKTYFTNTAAMYKDYIGLLVDTDFSRVEC